MEKHDFNVLLENYLKGQVSQEDEAKLAAFFEESGDHLKDTSLSSLDQERLFTDFSHSPRFRSQPASHAKNRLRWLSPLRSWQSAAIWLLAILTVSAVWLLQRNTSPEEITYKEIRAPRGQLVRIVLADCSEVMLNANSILRYHPDFVHHRQVQLTGEAFFKVHPDKAHPFRISTHDSLITEVLGTEFNVCSYFGSAHTKVTVLSGRVKVQHQDRVLGVLTPRESIAYEHQTGVSSKNMIPDTGNEMSWTKGTWTYDRMELNDLTLLLDNYYGVQVIYTGANNTKLSTDANMNFSRKQSAAEIVRIFCITTGHQYTWKDKTIVEIH